MPLPDGGLLDRLVEESIHRMLRDALTTLLWFEATESEGGTRRGYTQRVQLLPEPLAKDKQIPPNTAVLDMDDIDDDGYEMGNGVATSRRYLGYVDFYGENRSVGGQFAGDASAILRGDFPSIGRDAPRVDVVDWSLATPDSVTFCAIENVRTLRSRGTSSTWDGLIWSIQFEALVDND